MGSDRSAVKCGVPPLPAGFEVIPIDERVRAMAERWQASQDQLVAMLDKARENPLKWLRIVADDEAHPDRPTTHC